MVLVFAGVLFGAGLAVSGMMNPARVIGFLDLMGDWDPTLAWVMGGAVGTAGLGLWGWRRRTGGAAWFGQRLPEAGKPVITRSLVLGSAVFGVGWGLSGFCPGPALANLALFRSEALVFVPAMLVGMVAARVVFGADRDEA